MHSPRLQVAVFFNILTGSDIDAEYMCLSAEDQKKLLVGIPLAIVYVSYYMAVIYMLAL
jgi:hypothetical protein